MNERNKERIDNNGLLYETKSRFSKQGNQSQAPSPAEILRIVKETTKNIEKKDGE